eukprot:693343_1
MSRRDVIGEVGEKVPKENENLVELHKSEHPQNMQQMGEQIKDKQEQEDPLHKTKPSISTYLAIFQWLLLIFCVFSNIYLLTKPSVQCECDRSSAQSQIVSIIPTTNSPTEHPTVSPQTTTSYPSVPSLNPTVSSSNQPTHIPSFAPTVSPTQRPSTGPTKQPTSDPSPNPSTGPTKQPTRHPSSDPSTRPSAHPSVAPSVYPSESPTYFDGQFVGDYKYSFRDESHGFWLLCHGQWLDITQYTLLYDVIGHQFGHYYNSTTHYFRVPDARDTVMGVAGSVHSIGQRVGNET